LRTESNKGATSIALLVAIALFAGSIAKGQGQAPPSERESRGSSLDGMATHEPAHDRKGQSVEWQLKTLHEQGRQAALKGDASFLEKYLSEDYLRIGVDGSILTKDQQIQMLRSGAIKYYTIDERDVKVSVYGDAAVLNVLVFLKMTINAKPITGLDRATFVWVKQDGNWKEVFFQATRVAPPSRRPGDNLGHDAPPAPR
jgi:hypothetical protein